LFSVYLCYKNEFDLLSKNVQFVTKEYGTDRFNLIAIDFVPGSLDLPLIYLK